MAVIEILPIGDNTYDGAALSNPPNSDYTITQAPQTPPGNGNNTITLDNGNDQITLGNGNNTITAGNGADQITLGDGNNPVTLGDGNDTITAGAGNNTITTGNGDSVIAVGNGNDGVSVGTGSNTITLGNLVTPLLTQLDTVNTNAGRNTVYVSAQAITGDTLMGALVSGDGTTNHLVLTTAGTMSPVNVSGFQSFQLADGGANSLTLSEANFARLPGGVITVFGGDSGTTVNAAALSAAHAVTVHAGSGIAALTGGAGNDLFIFTPGNLSGDTVDGGTGMNTLELAAGAGIGTLTGLGGPSFTNIGVINVDSGANWLFTSTQAVTDTINLADSATAEFTGAVPSGHTTAFTAAGATLELGSPGQPDSLGQFAGTITVTGSQPGTDTIDLAGVAADGYSYAGGVLTVTNGATDVAQLTLSNAVVVSPLASDGNGGTAITVEGDVGLVTGFYTQVLDRAPDAGGLAHWTSDLSAGMTPQNVHTAIAASGEAYNDLSQLYTEVLGRNGDAAGLTSWTNQLADGVALYPNVITDFANSAESQNNITQAYEQYLGRDPETAGLTYWEGQLAGGVSLQTVQSDIAGSAEAQLFVPSH